MTVIRILVYFLFLFLTSPILNGFASHGLDNGLCLLLVWILCVPILDLPSHTLTFVPNPVVVYLQPLQVAVFYLYWNADYAASIRPTLLVLSALPLAAIHLATVAYKCCSTFVVLALNHSQVTALSTAVSLQPPNLDSCFVVN